VDSLAASEVKDLEDAIKPVGFYHTKAKHIKQASQMLIDDFNGEVPNDLQSLLKLPGVGKKMANIALASCFNNVVGIGVDVHVHRISNRLNWTSTQTKTPEKTREELESWMPRELWKEVNLLLVGFGQQICTPKLPHCGDCLNSSNGLCPYAFSEEKSKKSPSKKSSKKKVEEN
jgi:endonuclease III